MQQTEKAEKAFKKNLGALQEVFDFIHSFFRKHNIDEEFCFSIDLVIEELFTNMIKYSRESNHDITLALQLAAKQLVMTMVDTDVEAFDITQAGDVDVNKGLADRKVGGLGIHLVRKLVDEMKYEYADRQSKITLIKYLENKDV